MIVVKQPAEILELPLAFAASIDAIAGVVVVAKGAVVGGGASLDASAAVVGVGTALVQVGGGADGERYLVTVRGEAGAELLERELEIVVIDATWTMPDGGVPYLTIAEFVDLFGLEEVVQMTDRSGNGRIDRGYLVAALRAAQGVANVNLAAKYAVPIATVPDAIKTAIADLARARLYVRGAPDGVERAAKDATALLGRIATGAVPLPLPAGETAAPSTAEPGIQFTPGRRAYPDDLRGY